MFKIKNLRDLNNPEAPSYSPIVWLRSIGYVKKQTKDILERNKALEKQVRDLRAEIAELSGQLQAYGDREISLYMEESRHQETCEMLEFLSTRDGFKYTHIAAEQKIQMLEKELASLRRHCNSGWECYRALEKQWLKFIYEYVDGGAYPQTSGKGNHNGCSEEN